MKPKNNREVKGYCSFVMVENGLPLSQAPPLFLMVEIEGTLKNVPISKEVMDTLTKGCNGDGLKERNLLKFMEKMPKVVTLIEFNGGDNKIFKVKEEDIEKWLHTYSE